MEKDKFCQNVYIEEEMESSYAKYALSVIASRAISDVRDGLKPVQRRIIFAMYENNITHDKPFKKSARIVGEVLGKYHPHGDMSVYYAAVRMAQIFTLRYPLIKGQGNFGSIDGDNPAASRYTEMKLTKMSEEMIDDIDKECVEFIKNFDDSLYEPIVLPSKIPNLLINGSSGIAVGYATHIPTHNVKEICNAIEFVLNNEEASLIDVMSIVKGPDFPSGCTIFGGKSLFDIYSKGRGSFKIRSKVEYDDEKIVVKEIPYQVNKAELVKKIADLVKEKKIDGINELRDESDRDGLRIFIGLKKDSNPEVVLNNLYKHSDLEVNHWVLMLALKNNFPKIFNLKELIQEHIDYRFEVITKRSIFELRIIKEKLHILSGFMIAVKNIDEFVKIIKTSKDISNARETLMKKFSLTLEQSKAILDMKLSKLTNLEVDNLFNEVARLEGEVIRLENILKDKNEVKKIIIQELQHIKNKYGDERKTEIASEYIDFSDEDFITNDIMLVTVSLSGYIKRQNLNDYRSQNRGGKGYSNLKSGNDAIQMMCIAKNLDYVILFTNFGRLYSMKTYLLPLSTKNAKGKLVSNFVYMQEEEKLSSILYTTSFSLNCDVVFVTKKGVVKRTKLSDFKKISGVKAIKLDENDELINVFFAEEKDDIFIATQKGYAIKFILKDVNSTGRNTRGVRGISLRKEDCVVSGFSVQHKDEVLVISSNGYGKKSSSSSYNRIKRGGKGVKNMKITSKIGDVVFAGNVVNSIEVMILTNNGSIIRMMVDKISKLSRNTQGVRLMRISGENHIIGATNILSE